MSNTMVIVTAVVALAALIAVLQVLARVLSSSAFEPRWRPLSLSGRGARVVPPGELVQLESMIAAALAGDAASRARLTSVLAAAGVAVDAGTTPADLVAAIGALPTGIADRPRSMAARSPSTAPMPPVDHSA